MQSNTFERDPFKVNDKHHHIASWGYRSWLEHCLGRNGVGLDRGMFTLDQLESILKVIGAEF